MTKVIQIVAVDPGYQTHYLYEDGSIWVRQIKWDEETKKYTWQWGQLELPQ